MTEGLKQIEGQITSINHEKRGVAIKDKAGDTHPFYWSENVKMVNHKGDELKQWWFIKVIAEKAKDDTWWITSQAYFQRPDDWPSTGGRKPTGQYQQRNEGLIVHQTTYKECCETARCLMLIPDGAFDEEEYNRLMDVALERSIKDAKALIIAAGEPK
jgi:hypothetical protein